MYFYFIIPLLFLCDITLFQVLEKPVIQLLTCTYIVSILYQSINNYFYIFFFLMLEQSIYYDSLVPAFLLYGSLGFTFLKVNHLLNLSFAGLPYAYLVSTLIIKDIAFDSWTLSGVGGYYTLLQIYANIMVLFVIVKLMLRGKLGNRL